MATRSMSLDQAVAIASQVLENLKLFAPQSMPRMDSPEQRQALMRLYADAISRIHLPVKVFPVAALKVAGDDLGGRLIGVPDFKKAVWRAHEELLIDEPGYRAECEQIRHRREQQRHLQMGLTADGRSPELCQRAGNVDQKAVEATKKRFRRKWADKPNKPARDGNQSESDATGNDNATTEPPTTPN